MQQLTQINLFPIKSCGGYPVDSALMEYGGLQGDRRYMLVNEHGQFLSQRTQPRMSLIQVKPDDEGFVVVAPGQSTLSLPTVLPADDMRRVKIWKDELTAILAPAATNDWFAAALGIPCQLVYMSKPNGRALKSAYGRPEDGLSFADGAPATLISSESLAELNQRLEQSVEMKRFRPNFVVTAGTAFAEDRWLRIRIGSAEFEVAWPCTRCVIPTVDPATGKQDPLGEPIVTLNTFRLSPSGVTLGQNLIPRRLGRVQVGDSVEIVESSDHEERDTRYPPSPT
jgi:uncharacterized protein YcbX